MVFTSTVGLRLLLDELLPLGVVEGIGNGEDVLVSTAGLVDEDRLARVHVGRFLEGLDEGVGRLERWDEALFAYREGQRVDDLVVRGGLEAHALLLVKIGEDGRDAHVVEARRDAVGVLHLTISVLEEVGLVPLCDADEGISIGEARRVEVASSPLAAGFDPDEFDVCVVQKTREHPDGVRSATHTGVYAVGQAPRAGEHLLPRLVTDDRLEPRHHCGEGVGSTDGAQGVVGRVHVGDPVAKRLVDGVLERAAALGHGDDRGAEALHPEHVGALAFDVDFTHVDGALEPELCRHGRGGDTMLSCAGLGNDPGLPHALDQEALAHYVVGLVGAGVVEVFPFDEDARPSEVFRQVLRIGDGRRSAGVGAHEGLVLVPEGRVGLRRLERGREFVEGGDENLGDVAAPEVPVVAAPVRHGGLQCVGRR